MTPDPAGLREVLLAQGMAAEPAGRFVADVRWGVVLQPDGAAVSRIGGLPVVPEGTAWPTADDRALTHVVTVACAELPEIEDRDLLPADGFLSFFVDLTAAGAPWEVLEPDAPGRERVAILHAPQDAGVTLAAPPSGDRPGDDIPPVLPERRMRPVARRQLRTDVLPFSAAYELTLEDERAHREVAERVNGEEQHQLLGHPWCAQGDPRPYARTSGRPEPVTLLHVGWDRELDLTVGSLHLFADPEDVRARRWDRVTVWPTYA